jgi:hypothetical protein
MLYPQTERERKEVLVMMTEKIPVRITRLQPGLKLGTS